jgi:hypothetical protein
MEAVKDETGLYRDKLLGGVLSKEALQKIQLVDVLILMFVLFGSFLCWLSVKNFLI